VGFAGGYHLLPRVPLVLAYHADASASAHD
jgi:hypothetical protein